MWPGICGSTGLFKAVWGRNAIQKGVLAALGHGEDAFALFPKGGRQSAAGPRARAIKPQSKIDWRMVWSLPWIGQYFNNIRLRRMEKE